MNCFSHKNFFCPPDNDGQFYKHNNCLNLIGTFNRKFFYWVGLFSSVSPCRTDWKPSQLSNFSAWIFSRPTQGRVEKIGQEFLNATGTNYVKKRSPSLPIFSSISPRSFSKAPVKASKSFVSLRLTIPLTRNRLLARGNFVPPWPPVRQRHTAQIRFAHKLVCQWRTCTLGLQLSLRSNADPSVTFGTSFASPKRRENEPFSLTTRQANASLVYPFLPRLSC